MAAPAAAVALASSPAPATAHRGQLISATPLGTFKDRAAVTARLKADGFNVLKTAHANRRRAQVGSGIYGLSTLVTSLTAAKAGVFTVIVSDASGRKDLTAGYNL